MPVRGAERRICDTVVQWSLPTVEIRDAGSHEKAAGDALHKHDVHRQVTAAPHRYGGTEFRLGRREIGHIHRDSLVDIPFPRAVRDALVAQGEAAPHHILPHSGWVSIFLRSDADVERAIRLLRHSFDLAAELAAKHQATAKAPVRG
jgi:predicted DNA-binding protein (MmcQ/YjbR family)